MFSTRGTGRWLVGLAAVAVLAGGLVGSSLLQAASAGGGSSSRFARDLDPESLPDALHRVLTLPLQGGMDPAGTQEQWVLAVAVLAGLALAGRRALPVAFVWLVWSALAVAYLVDLHAPGLDLVWDSAWNSYYRVVAHGSPWAWLLAGVAVVRAAGWLTRGRRAEPVVAAVLGLALLAGAAVASGPTEVRALRERYADPAYERIDADDQAAARYLASVVRPGQRVMNSGNDGSTYAYVLEGSRSSRRRPSAGLAAGPADPRPRPAGPDPAGAPGRAPRRRRVGRRRLPRAGSAPAPGGRAVLRRPRVRGAAGARRPRHRAGLPPGVHERVGGGLGDRESGAGLVTWHPVAVPRAVPDPDQAADTTPVPEQVVAVVVAYDRRDLLLAGLDALADQTRRPDVVVVVDNASSDGSPVAVREWAAAHDLTVDLVELPRNTGGAGGFAAGLARAVHRHAADAVWLMDDDTVPRPSALAESLIALRRTGPPSSPAASCGPTAATTP